MTRWRLTVLALALAVAAAGMGGCDKGQPIKAKQNFMEDPQIRFVGPDAKDLRDRLEIRFRNYARQPDGMLDAHVRFYNRTSQNAINIDYRFQFVDQNGTMVEEAPWMETIIDPRSEKQITAQSMRRDCYDYRLYLRWAR